MRAVVTDLDRTLTDEHLAVAPQTFDAIASLRRAGVAVVLASGRPVHHLRGLVAAFDGVVAENGAVLHVGSWTHVQGAGFPSSGRAALGTFARYVTWQTVIGSAPLKFSRALGEILEYARVPHALVRNADEIMLLPPGVGKGSGALRVLARLGIPAQDAVAIGDNDNDVDLFLACGRSVAVANATEAAREAADDVLDRPYGEGFVAFAESMLTEGDADRTIGVARRPRGR